MIIAIRNHLDKVRAVNEIKALEIGEDGALWAVHIKPFQKDRSLAQNRLFHMWCEEIAKDTGNDLEAVKTRMKTLFGKTETVRWTDKDGKEILTDVLVSTTKYKVKEMKELLDAMLPWAATDLGIYLPVPIDLRWSIE